MAKKKTAASGTAKRRKRRSPEEIIADLQKKIEEVKHRQEAKKLKQSGAIRAAISAVKAIDKSVAAAEEEEDTSLRHALADAREPLVAVLTERGIQLPKTRRPKGRRPGAK